MCTRHQPKILLVRKMSWSYIILINKIVQVERQINRALLSHSKLCMPTINLLKRQTAAIQTSILYKRECPIFYTSNQNHVHLAAGTGILIV